MINNKSPSALSITYIPLLDHRYLPLRMWLQGRVFKLVSVILVIVIIILLTFVELAQFGRSIKEFVLNFLSIC